MWVRILSGNQAGQVLNLPRPEADSDVACGYARWATRGEIDKFGVGQEEVPKAEAPALEEEAETTVDPGEELAKLNVNALKALAKEEGVELEPRANKAAIVEAIVAARKTAAETPKDEAPALEDMSNDELAELAKEEGVDIDANETKADLIAKIMAARLTNG